jgi:hypothetical protein
MKKLFLHIGVAKTGSSALQVAFAQNVDLLEKAGINYWRDSEFEKAKAGETTSGNGVDLFRHAYPEAPSFKGTFDRVALAGCFPRYFGGRDRALLSSELLGNMPPVSWRRIIEAYKGTIRVVAYVRNATDSLWSAYCHISRMHLFSGTFEEFLESPNGYYIPKRALHWCNRTLGSDQITALHYESHKGDIVTPIFEALGIDAGDRIKVGSINTNAAKPEIPDQYRDLIARRFCDEVTWLNQTFFDGKRVVTV